MNNERVRDLLFRAQAEQEPSRDLEKAIRCTGSSARVKVARRECP